MDEEQLISDADPDFEAFVEQYRRNSTRVYRYHMLHVGDANAAEDLTAQTFMTALKESPSKGSFAVRVLEIAREKSSKDPRSKKLELSHDNDAVLYYQVSSLPGNKAAMQRMEIESISRSLKQISSAQAEAIILYFFCGLSGSEISLVLNKSPETIETLISRGAKDLHAYTSRSSRMEAITSDLEDDALINKLNDIAASIRVDPHFESELELTLAKNHKPKAKWTPPLQALSTMMGWVILIGITFFLLIWRVPPNPSSQQATARPPTQDGKKTETILATSTPPRPTASPTATNITFRKYVVQAGDTCTYIANKFGVTIDLLITLNNLNSSCDLWADQTIKIPTLLIPTPASQ